MTIFQKGGSTHVPPTLLVIRVVLLHTLYGGLNPFFPQLYVVHYNYSDELSIRIFRSAMKVRRGEKPPLICFEVLFAQKIAFLMHFLRLLEFGNNNKCTNQQSNSVFLEWVLKKFHEVYNPHP